MPSPHDPFVDAALRSRALQPAEALAAEASSLEEGRPPAEALRAMVALFGERGLLRLVTDEDFGGAFEDTSSRALCLARETLGRASPLADLAFAMQGLGSYPITFAARAHGATEPASRWLPPIVAGRFVAAFALTEPEAGTDLGGIAARAERTADGYRLRGRKVFISNAGIADTHVVFAVTAPDAPRRRLSAFVVPADAPGLSTRATRVLGGHPIGELHLDDVPVPEGDRLGPEGAGLAIALATLHRFRPTVGAAAVGFAQRALDEALAHVKRRHQFGAPLAELPLVQARLGEMACELEAARMLVYRAAWMADVRAPRSEVTRTSSMAKLVATEAAQQIIDSALQLHGGRGVLADGIVARLYQEVRALRIYEGTNDIHKILIARELLR